MSVVVAACGRRIPSSHRQQWHGAGADRKSLKIGTVEAPFAVRRGEDLTLRIFIDKNLVEVFANDRQAAVFAHRHIRGDPNIRLFAKGGNAAVESVKAWNIKSIYRDPADVADVADVE